MTRYQLLQQELRAAPRVWCITGVAGFIGSHLLETLLRLEQRVVGIDDFSTGSARHLDEVRRHVGDTPWTRFIFYKNTIADYASCRTALAGADFVLHHAGFVSVPRSIENPVACHETNVTGTLNILAAARELGVRRVVFASSSAVYGDDPRQPNVEAQIGRPLSPYGASKLMGEIYARQFHEHYSLETVGLRYFNIFGPRQHPRGGYAAVIPQWITHLLAGEPCRIHGDGRITRDFCPVADVVQANLLAATAPREMASGEVFNVALGAPTTLDELYASLAKKVAALGDYAIGPAHYGPARPGDIRHSGADIFKIKSALSFTPTAQLDSDLEETVRWYSAHRGA